MVSRKLLSLAYITLVFNRLANSCSWSNEGCSEDSECCSHSCHKAHEGTNPRCRQSTLGEGCIFDYHCQEALTCGDHFNCCSPYWKMCIKDSDCCNKDHVCRPADGFFYDRCLYPSSASILAPGVSNSVMMSFLWGVLTVGWMLLFQGGG